MAPDDVRDLIREEIRAALAERSEQPAPALLDRRGLATALDVCLDKIDALRKQGMPTITIGDVPRFELDRCLEWLRGRE
jgi:hypothetical protein